MRWIVGGLTGLTLSIGALDPQPAVAANTYGLVIGIDD